MNENQRIVREEHPHCAPELEQKQRACESCMLSIPKGWSPWGAPEQQNLQVCVPGSCWGQSSLVAQLGPVWNWSSMSQGREKGQKDDEHQNQVIPSPSHFSSRQLREGDSPPQGQGLLRALWLLAPAHSWPFPAQGAQSHPQPAQPQPQMPHESSCTASAAAHTQSQLLPCTESEQDLLDFTETQRLLGSELEQRFTLFSFLLILFQFLMLLQCQDWRNCLIPQSLQGFLEEIALNFTLII